MFFTKGVGRHKNNLESFEAALREAGIARCNLVKVSSIFPPGCKIIKKEEGIGELKPGGITFCVMAEQRDNEPSRRLCAGIGLALPEDKNEQYGYLSEHHGFGMTSEETADYVEDMAASMLATTLNIDLDPNTTWDQRQELYKGNDIKIRTKGIVQTAECDKTGWTTVCVAAVFLMD